MKEFLENNIHAFIDEFGSEDLGRGINGVMLNYVLAAVIADGIDYIKDHEISEEKRKTIL